MGLISLRHPRRVAAALLAVVALAAAIDGFRLVQAERWNARIASGELPADAQGVPREVQFAQAAALAASGATDGAMNRYGALQGDDALGQAARFNAANLMLRQGATLRGGAQPGLALAPIELAKEGYREVLRREPGHWAARYNLERAQRLLPDPGEVEELPPDSRRNAERAMTTMRGYSPGLP